MNATQVLEGINRVAKVVEMVPTLSIVGEGLEFIVALVQRELKDPAFDAAKTLRELTQMARSSVTADWQTALDASDHD